MALPIIAGIGLGALGGAAAGALAATSFGVAAGAIGGGLIGGSVGAQVHAGGMAADAARDQARLQNEYIERQYAYDVDLWNMTKERIIDDRQFALEEIKTKAQNERTLAEYQDATNLANYGYQLQIRNREQESLENQYLRSTNIYGLQTTINADTARSAREDELRRLQETEIDSAFQLQERRIEQMQAEGTLRSRGVSGRSATKVEQASLADLGRQMAMLNESMESAGRNTKAILKDIQRDKVSADLTAYANRMLEPGELPETVAPFQTPLAEYLYPRQLEDHDFGPMPIRGARTDANAASSRIWASTISGIAGQAGALASKAFG